MDVDKEAFPVRLVHTRSRGRELTASCEIAAGDVVLRCLPLALAPADSARRTRCAACLSDAPGGEACAGGCGSVLCAHCVSDARWAATHAAGECVSLRHLWTLLGRTPGGAVAAASGGGTSAAAAAAAVAAPAAAAAPPACNKRRRACATPPPAAAPQAESAALCVLLRLAYVRALEAAPEADALPPLTECPHGDALADAADAADELVSHFEALSDAQARRPTRVQGADTRPPLRRAKSFTCVSCSLLGAQRAHAFGMADTARWCLVAGARRGREALARDAVTLWCNSFDVVDAESGASLGEGLWPSAALGLNHRRVHCSAGTPPGVTTVLTHACLCRLLAAVSRTATFITSPPTRARCACARCATWRRARC
jgi:hypothetical protein